MSNANAVAQHLPFLRRYARAITGTQTSGDAYVAAVLEAISRRQFGTGCRQRHSKRFQGAGDLYHRVSRAIPYWRAPRAGISGVQALSTDNGVGIGEPSAFLRAQRIEQVSQIALFPVEFAMPLSGWDIVYRLIKGAVRYVCLGDRPKPSIRRSLTRFKQLFCQQL
jgi:hypothetical protein